MSKNFLIILFAGLFLVAVFTRSCGNKPQPNNYVEDSLKHAIKLKVDTIKTLQVQFDNLNTSFTTLQQQKQKIKYERDTIWLPKKKADSIINAYSDSETIKRFMLRFYSN